MLNPKAKGIIHKYLNECKIDQIKNFPEVL
jgi:hypothetical protein